MYNFIQITFHVNTKSFLHFDVNLRFLTKVFVLTVMYQKRLKKERKQRQMIQEQLELELKRRQKVEEALKQSGAPSEILRIVTGKWHQNIVVSFEILAQAIIPRFCNETSKMLPTLHMSKCQYHLYQQVSTCVSAPDMLTCRLSNYLCVAKISPNNILMFQAELIEH